MSRLIRTRANYKMSKAVMKMIKSETKLEGTYRNYVTNTNIYFS